MGSHLACIVEIILSVIQSAEGVQQGDPMGPLLFCLSIQQLVYKLQSELVLFYLDDGTIAGSLQDVLADLRLIEFEASKLGLELNHSKSEVICDQPSVQEAMLSEVPGLYGVPFVSKLKMMLVFTIHAGIYDSCWYLRNMPVFTLHAGIVNTSVKCNAPINVRPHRRR